MKKKAEPKKQLRFDAATSPPPPPLRRRPTYPGARRLQRSLTVPEPMPPLDLDELFRVPADTKLHSLDEISRLPMKKREEEE